MVETGRIAAGRYTSVVVATASGEKLNLEAAYWVSAARGSSSPKRERVFAQPCQYQPPCLRQRAVQTRSSERLSSTGEIAFAWVRR